MDIAATSHPKVGGTMTSTVFFDLDGTLTDSRPGILASYAEAFDRCGMTPTRELTSDVCIGPPLRKVLASLVAEEHHHRLAELYDAFQVRFSSTGWSENAVYAGVPEMLAGLRAAGVPMHVATSKALLHADRIIRHFALRDFFGAIHGAESDGRRSHKTEVLAYALEREGVDPKSAIMVGDRHHDMEAARSLGVRAVGVTYGYGGERELLDAGAEVLVASPTELAARLALGRA